MIIKFRISLLTFSIKKYLPLEGAYSYRLITLVLAYVYFPLFIKKSNVWHDCEFFRLKVENSDRQYFFTEFIIFKIVVHTHAKDRVKLDEIRHL